jgi:putative ABC transport system ATP-binding protein
VLSAVSLEARPGLPVAVMGPSGAGKSTLLAVLAGLLEPATGEVCLDDVRVGTGADDAARARIALVLQSYGLVDVLTAWENVAIALQAKGFSRREVADRTAAILAEFGLTDVAHHAADELSGGQKQRVAVARALVGRPDVVLADEPTAELDAANRTMVLDQLIAAADQGVIVVIASHDPEVAARCARQATLVDGRIA